MESRRSCGRKWGGYGTAPTSLLVAVAEELHFGRAARRLDMLPSALGRPIRLLEESLGTPLLLRTTRNVTLSQDGVAFLDDARSLLAQADELGRQFRECGRRRSQILRVGAIDMDMPLAATTSLQHHKMSAFGTKRTSRLRVVMSAFDPKRTGQRKHSSSPFSSSYPLQQPFRHALDLLLSLIDGRYKALPAS
jgi:hypothetical protein